jgi:redox-sensitive bicupin YhaK (pirin superfamily)
LTLSFPANFTTAILAIEGSATLSGEKKLPTNNLAVFESDGEEFTVTADEDSVLLLMAGEPLNEPIAQYGPFLMNTKAEIAQAIDDYQQGKFGYLAD